MVLSVIKAVGLCDIFLPPPRAGAARGSLGAVVMAGEKGEGTLGWRGFQQLYNWMLLGVFETRKI